MLDDPASWGCRALALAALGVGALLGARAVLSNGCSKLGCSPVSQGARPLVAPPSE